MPHTILTPPQITPATVVRQDGQGIDVIRENPEKVVLPPGMSILYLPPGYSRFSSDPALRSILLNDPEGKATLAEILVAFPDILDSKYAALWQAAHEYEQKYISGVGLSILSLGVAQGKPKALAVAAWSQNLWTLYYQRKAAIAIDNQPELDFTPATEMPYSVPELSAEVWG